ncbi:MAG TPA: hypothetical protein VIM74_04565 [Casimicrobiaceae bacterium]
MTGVERPVRAGPARDGSPGAPAAHAFARALPLFLFAGLCLSSLDTTAKYLVRDHSLFLGSRCRSGNGHAGLAALVGSESGVSRRPWS